MKIFFVNTNKQWGGGEKWHFDNALALKHQGHYVAILTLHDSELYIRSLAAGLVTIPVHVSNLSFMNPLAIFKLFRLFKSRKPDIVILNFSADVKAAGIAARVAGIVKVIYRRGNAKPIRNSLVNRILYKELIHRIIANSEQTKRAILHYNANLYPADKIHVIYNGIDLQQYDSLPLDKLYIKKNNEIVIGTAGRLSLEKGHMILIEAALQLRQRHVNFICLIAGEGPEENILKQEVRNMGLEQQVIFLGFVNNIKAFMSSLDIFVLPSLWEGFGYVTVEAMAGNLPVVAFRTGSNPEIIVDQVTGFLVEEHEAEALSDKIDVLIHDPLLRTTMGREGRKRAKEVFSSNKSGQELEQFLMTL